MSGDAVLLGGGYSWRSGDPSVAEPGWSAMAVVANPVLGLSLGTLATGPLGLASRDDSLGQVVLPRGVAVDGGQVLVLSTDGSRIYRYDSVKATLVALPEVGATGVSPHAPAGVFLEPRRFRGASNIAAIDGTLYVADPNAHRVQVFELTTLALIRIHDGIADPADVAAAPQGVFILDRATGRVLRTSSASDEVTVVVRARKPGTMWDRIAIDRAGLIYLRDRRVDPPVLHVFRISADGKARLAGQIANSAEIRDRFDPPVITMDARGGLVLPPRLLDPCGLRGTPDPDIRAWRIGDRYAAIDTRRRVVTIHLADGRVRHRFGPYDGQGRASLPDAQDAWSPVDLTTAGGCLLVLDDRHRAVHAWRPGAETLRQWFAAPADFSGDWRRIAEDGHGCLLLWDGVGDVVQRVDQHGALLGTVPIRPVRARFNRPEQGTRPADERPARRLTRDGAVAISPTEAAQYPDASFYTHAVWTSQWLDSDLYNCQWHVLELAVRTLPPGARIVVRTRTSNEAQSEAEVLASLGTLPANGGWRETPALVGPAQPDAQEAAPQSIDVLVSNGPGQYLQLEIELTGSGLTTPIIESLRIRFPRESLLQYLPAIYSKPEDQREFLDRFLSIAQTTWTRIEQDIATFSRYLDPDTVPDDALPWLAGWLGLTLEGTWTAAQNRRLLRALTSLRTTWGTAAGLRAWVRVYIASFAGVDERVLEEAGVPGIVESFVERRRLMLNREGATLCASDGLWSPSVERRFQVNVFDREGEIELVSHREPDLDMFRHYAHSFRVYVPAAFVRTAANEALLRRAIDRQRPAHTTYELVLIEPRFQIGVQSTIALDSIIGAATPGPLLCATVDDAPARPPYERLGYDITLGGAHRPGALDESLG